MLALRSRLRRPSRQGQQPLIVLPTLTFAQLHCQGAEVPWVGACGGCQPAGLLRGGRSDTVLYVPAPPPPANSVPQPERRISSSQAAPAGPLGVGGRPGETDTSGSS